MAKAHRFAYELTRGPVPEGLHVLHDCPGGDNPACCNERHLWLGTNDDNVADKVAKGRQAKGEGHAAVMRRAAARGDANGLRLHPERAARGDASGARTRPERRPRGEAHGRTMAEVASRGEAHFRAKLTDAAVVDIRTSILTARELGARYGVSERVVLYARSGKTWKHVAAPPPGPQKGSAPDD